MSAAESTEWWKDMHSRLDVQPEQTHISHSDQNEPATVDSGVFPWPLFLFPATSGGSRLNCGDSIPTIWESATPEFDAA